MAESTSNVKAPLLEEVLQGLAIKDLESSTKEPESASSKTLGSKCQTKILYEGRPKCDCCVNWVEQYPQEVRESVEETSDAKKYALICRVKKAHENSKTPLELDSLVIQNPHLKQILGEVLAGYTDVTTTLEDVVFKAPFWEFFYRWKQLTEVQCESEVSEYLQLLLKTLTAQLSNTHSVANDMAQNKVITYDYMWTLFPPKSLVYYRLFGQESLLEITRTEYYKGSIETYDLYCRYIEWDGEKFGWKTKLIEVRPFTGTKKVFDLEVYPIGYHKSQADLQSKLLERGRKFVSLGGCHHKAYQGKIKVSSESFFGSKEFHVRVLRWSNDFLRTCHLMLFFLF